MIDVYLPRENLNDNDVTVVFVSKKSGESVVAGELIVQVETSKTNVDYCATSSGVLIHQLHAGKSVNVGEILYTISDSNQENKVSDEVISGELKRTDFCLATNIKISEKAENYIKKFNINYQKLTKSWLTLADVQIARVSKLDADDKDSQNSVDLTLEGGSIKKEKISKRKQLEIQQLTKGNNGNIISSVATTFTLPGERKQTPHLIFKKTIGDLIVYEASKLLKIYGKLNAYYYSDDELHLYQHINFGMSFDNGNNLKVLSIENSNLLTLQELQAKIIELMYLYESGERIPTKLLTNSTVTLTDLSYECVDFIFPLLNGNQSLILGLVKKSDYSYQIFSTFDHRVTDGKEVSSFLSDLKRNLLMHFSKKTYCCFYCEKTISEEIKLGNRGMIKIIDEHEKSRLICRNCFDLR